MLYTLSQLSVLVARLPSFLPQTPQANGSVVVYYTAIVRTNIYLNK